MLVFDQFLTGSRLDKIKSSPIGPAPSKVTWNWPAECDFRVGKGSRLPRLKLSAENAPEKDSKRSQKCSFLTSFWMFLDSGSLAESQDRAELILRLQLRRMRLISRNFLSVQNRGKSTRITWTKFLWSKSKVRRTGRNQASPLGNDLLSAIFQSETLRESLASSYPRKTIQRKTQKVARNTRFWPVCLKSTKRLQMAGHAKWLSWRTNGGIRILR